MEKGQDILPLKTAQQATLIATGQLDQHMQDVEAHLVKDDHTSYLLPSFDRTHHPAQCFTQETPGTCELLLHSRIRGLQS